MKKGWVPQIGRKRRKEKREKEKDGKKWNKIFFHDKENLHPVSIAPEVYNSEAIKLWSEQRDQTLQ